MIFTWTEWVVVRCELVNWPTNLWSVHRSTKLFWEVHLGSDWYSKITFTQTQTFVSKLDLAHWATKSNMSFTLGTDSSFQQNLQEKDNGDQSILTTLIHFLTCNHSICYTQPFGPSNMINPFVSCNHSVHQTIILSIKQSASIFPTVTCNHLFHHWQSHAITSSAPLNPSPITHNHSIRHTH